MADEQAVVTDSAPAAEAAPPTEAAVAQSDVTHGDATEQPPTTDDTATPETPAEDDSPEDDDGDELPDTATEEEKTKAQKRRERRQAREEERIAKAVQDRLDQAERTREIEATQKAADAKTKQAEEAWRKEFGDLVGTPEERTTLDQEIGALAREIASLRPYADGTDLDTLEQKQAALDEKLSRRDTLNANQKTYDKIDQYQFEITKGLYASLADKMPSDHARAYLKAQTVPEALSLLEAGIVAREATKHEADKAAAVKAVTAELEKERAAHAATRTGGPGSGPVPVTGGNGGASGGTLIQRLIREAGSPEAYAERAARGDYAHINFNR